MLPSQPFANLFKNVFVLITSLQRHSKMGGRGGPSGAWGGGREKESVFIIIIIIIKAFIHLNILVTKHKIFTKIIFEMNGG